MMELNAPQHDTPEVITSTDTVLVLHKPAGLITHSDGRTKEPSLAEWVAEHYPALAEVGEPWISPQGEHVRVCGLVHRLDRATSGVILAAKTNAAFEHLKRAFKERRVEKHYCALVHGHVQADTGTIVAEIARSGEVPKRWYAKPTVPQDKRAAITHWRVLARHVAEIGGPTTCVDLQPETGRTHQLRVHLASIGHPIAGDQLYAPDRPALPDLDRLALHAYSVTVDDMTFVAPLPEVLDRVSGKF